MTQLDRIEKMLKVLVQANTTLEFDGDVNEQKQLANDVKKIKVSQEV